MLVSTCIIVLGCHSEHLFKWIVLARYLCLIVNQCLCLVRNEAFDVSGIHRTQRIRKQTEARRVTGALRQHLVTLKR
jgi:hypothetical protein